MKYQHLLCHFISWILLISYSIAGVWMGANRPAVALMMVTAAILLSMAGVFYYCLLLVYPFCIRKGRKLLLIPALLLSPVLFAALYYALMKGAHQLWPNLKPLAVSEFEDYLLQAVYLTLPAVIVSAVVWLIQHRFNRQKQEAAAWAVKLNAEIDYLKLQAGADFFEPALQAVQPLAYAVSDQLDDINNRLVQHWRYLHAQPANGRIALADELNAIENVIAVKKLLSAMLMYVDVKTESDLSGYTVAPLILLPLAEYALNNGITNDQSRPVRIVIKLIADRLVFTVSCKLKQQPDEALLTTMRGRLGQVYSGRYELLASANGQTSKTTLYLNL